MHFVCLYNVLLQQNYNILFMHTTLLRYIVLFNLCHRLQHTHSNISFKHNIMYFLYAIFFSYICHTTAVSQLQKLKSIDIYDNHSHYTPVTLEPVLTRSYYVPEIL